MTTDIGIFLIVYFIPFLIRYLQRFWGASGDFWQSHWEKIYNWVEGDSFTLGVWGMSAVMNRLKNKKDHPLYVFLSYDHSL